MTAKIVAENVSKVFGDDPEQALEMMKDGRTKDEILSETGMTVGVQDVNFSVEQGEIFVVMGLSGSGKSTLVRMLNRLIDASDGKIMVDGEDLLAANAEKLRQLRLEKLAMVFQHFALFPHKTVAENVEYGLKIAGVPQGKRRERALTALKQVGLDAWADRKPSALSGGMQQRVGLARGLAVNPEILLMDEPFSALDPLIRRDMQNELLELQREMKKTIVFITHDLDEALVLGDRIAIMKEGRFVQVGTAEEIVGNPADDYVAAFTQDVDRAKVFGLDSVMETPHALNLATDTVGAARDRLEELGRHALHVVDGGKLAGLVTHRALSDASIDANARLGDYVQTDIPTARPDTLLYKVYDQCTTGLPIAVVDESETLVGAVTPGAVFNTLAHEQEEPTDDGGADKTPQSMSA
ncbi:quaternary amine ABC transporter ATP-binding protein [Roseovarius salinarum]|uniref:quaternary amine ABC transporter ATP-binding protein n=1 Tax=Roseovarius salinarum TaxID=1981892 RepID=UPI000C335F81|nr:glycine betaine/L-proline ABC transporter ATP-binding protein [Roseovarius salinarum]